MAKGTERRFLPLKQASEIYGWTTRHFYNMHYRGEIKLLKICGRVVIDVAELDKLVANMPAVRRHGAMLKAVVR